MSFSLLLLSNHRRFRRLTAEPAGYLIGLARRESKGLEQHSGSIDIGALAEAAAEPGCCSLSFFKGN